MKVSPKQVMLTVAWSVSLSLNVLFFHVLTHDVLTEHYKLEKDRAKLIVELRDSSYKDEETYQKFIAYDGAYKWHLKWLQEEREKESLEAAKLMSLSRSGANRQ